MMNGRRKSDRFIVAKKPQNKDQVRPAEEMEGRDLAKGNPVKRARARTKSRRTLQEALDRVRKAARGDKRLRFTALWHHVYTIDRLRAAYYELKRNAAPGTDGET